MDRLHGHKNALVPEHNSLHAAAYSSSSGDQKQPTIGDFWHFYRDGMSWFDRIIERGIASRSREDRNLKDNFMNMTISTKTFFRYRIVLPALLSLCLTGGIVVPAGALSFGGGGTATPSPTATLQPPVSSIQSSGQGGALVTLTGTVTSPATTNLTVQWTVDGTAGQITTIPGATALTGASITYSQTYAPGTHTVFVTVSDGTNPSVSSTPITLTVLPPTNTSGGKVTGGGNIAVGSDKGTFGFVAKTNSSGSPQGNFVFQDHGTGRTVKSLQITGLIVFGTHAEFWGKAMINDDGEYDFVVDVDDFAEPGSGVDTFSLRMSDGYSAGGTVVDGGNIQIHK